MSEPETRSAQDLIDPRELAALLRPYDIQPRPLRHSSEVFRGYRCDDFDDALSS
jgi:hypothetical protein